MRYLIFFLFLSNSIFSQTARIRKSEISFQLFTAYDFDRFSILNNKNDLKYGTPLFNLGAGLAYTRHMKKSYYIKAEIDWWHAFIGWPKKFPKGSRNIVDKEASFWALGLGKRIEETKYFRFNATAQLMYRYGTIYTYTGVYDLGDGHYYRDVGLRLTPEMQLKITRFLAMSISAGYVFYMYKWDNDIAYYVDKPVVSRHSLMIHSGLSILF